MKKLSVLLISALLMVSSLVACAPAAQAPAPTETPALTAAPEQTAPAAATDAPATTAPVSGEVLPFRAEDFVLGDLKVDSTGDDATKLFGKPTEVFKSEAAASGDMIETWSYDFGELTFLNEGGKLLFIGGSVIDDSLAGPRGIMVGATFEQVKALFPHDGTKVDGDVQVLYSANFEDSASEYILPPRGFYDKEEGILYYDTPIEPYDDSVTKDISSFVFAWHYSCAFEFDTDDGTLTRITLYKGAFAE